MAPEQLRNPVEALQAQLRSALDAQLASLSSEYQAALDEARRAAQVEAEQALVPRLDAVHAEWSARLDSEVNAARTDAERRVIAETMQIRVEAEQQAAESMARLREELEHALAAERHRAETAVQEERTRAAGELASLRASLREAEEALTRAQADAETASRGEASAKSERAQTESQLQDLRSKLRDAEEAAQRAEDAAHRAEEAVHRARAEADEAATRATRATATAATGGRLDEVASAARALQQAPSLTATLDALLQHAARAAGRAAVFLINGDRITSLKSLGFAALDGQPFDAALAGTGMLGQAAQRGETISAGASSAAPTFAALPPQAEAVAVPIRVGDRIVALLYADSGGRTDSKGWTAAVDVMAAHASHALAAITATRTLQTLGGAGSAPAGEAARDEHGARRYARLLVSEIKLYNEAAVRQGRQQRDLLQRLRPEVDRARRLYEERVPASLDGRSMYFQQELVNTLADGDAALLGSTF